MNREFKRRMRKEEKQQKRAQARGGPRPPMPVAQSKRERVGIRQYVREIQSELKRVMWPTASEVMTYSIVVVLVVSVLTTVVFFLDLGFAQAIVKLFQPATGR